MMNISDPVRDPSASAPAAHSQPQHMPKHLLSPREEAEFLDPKGVAALLGISRLSVYRLIERRLVPSYRIFRCVRFRREDILAFVARQRTPVVSTPPYGCSQD